MKKYIVKLQYQETFLTYSEKLEYFEWLKARYECLPNNAFLTAKQFEKARKTVLKNLISYIVFIEEN